MSKNLKEDPLGFLTFIVAKYQKIKGEHFGDIWKIHEKKSHKSEKGEVS